MLESSILAIFSNVDEEERKRYMEGKGDDEYRP
jgi:hypothetical protein